jgi:hypothetical protein
MEGGQRNLGDGFESSDLVIYPYRGVEVYFTILNNILDIFILIYRIAFSSSSN